MTPVNTAYKLSWCFALNRWNLLTGLPRVLVSTKPPRIIKLNKNMSLLSPKAFSCFLAHSIKANAPDMAYKALQRPSPAAAQGSSLFIALTLQSNCLLYYSRIRRARSACKGRKQSRDKTHELIRFKGLKSLNNDKTRPKKKNGNNNRHRN